MSKTLSQRRLDRIHAAVGREVVEQYFSDPTSLESLLDEPTLLRRALIETISLHPRAGELRGLVRPTTAACLNLISSLVREAAAAGQIEGVLIETIRLKLISDLDHHIAPKTIEEMIRRNHAIHDLAVEPHQHRIRLRGDLLVQQIDQRHQLKLRQQSAAGWEAWS